MSIDSALADPCRLQGVAEAGLGDGAPPEAFGHLAVLATAGAQVTATMISVLTAEGQIVLGQAGLPPPFAGRRVIPYEQSLCKQVVGAGTSVCFPDLHLIEALRQLDLVQQCHLRAFAGVPLRDEEGRVLGSVSVLDAQPRAWLPRDVELLEHVAALAGAEVRSLRRQRRLDQDREQRHLLFEGFSDAFCVVDDEWRLHFVNTNAAAVLGQPSAELLRRVLWDVAPGLAGTPIQELLQDALQAARPRETVTWYEPDHRWYHVRAWPIEHGLGVFFLDVTEQRNADAQLREAENRKMEAMARMAGGVAHDVNNLLTVVQGVSELLLMGLHDGDPLREDVGHIQHAVHRTAHLAQQLLAFSRRQVLEPQAVDLSDQVAHLAAHLALPAGVDLLLDLTERPAPVLADRGQLEVAIRNLVANACEAMPDGGRLLLRTRHVTLDEARATELGGGLVPGDYVALSVTDTGVGMDEVTLARAFEPFFTTRHRGPSSGLGLSTASGIVEQSGGVIVGESEPGAGTTMTVYLPETRRPVELTRPVQLRPAAPVRGVETVLLVEDEDLVRRLACDALARLGYRVLEARNGVEALEIAAQHDIAVVVTDLEMPRAGGLELAERLARQRLDLPILFVSGYSEEAVGPRLHPCRTGFLQKPYTSGALVAAIRALLDCKDGKETT